MNSKERVLCTIQHMEPDRVPMNIWMFREDKKKEVCLKYGSMEKFFERYNIDLHMEITPPPCLTNLEYIEEKMNMEPDDIKPEHWMDPDDPRIYEGALKLKRQYGEDKAIAVHVWGVVESVYGFSGIEKTLVLMAAEPEFAAELFSKVCDFSARVVSNLLAIGIDILHITGDVGANGNMLFSPELYRTLVKPFDSRIIKPAIEKNVPVSLHSCGYCMPVIPDWIEMGVSMIHPIQESAGMDLFEVKKLYGDRITINGGLDLRRLCVLKENEVEQYVKPRMEALKKGGGFIYNTAHTVQPDTSLAILEKAYDTALKYSWY
jgi:uroporphyrinogen decarboxylase